MVDVVTPDVRSAMMAGIRGKNTKPELLLRSGLHRAGFRFRLHDRRLPGKPDLVFPKYRAVIFVHGCFWHGHECRLFRWPKSRAGFWREKIERNRETDKRAEAALVSAGWRCAIVWECALKGKLIGVQTYPVKTCMNWLKSKKSRIELDAETSTRKIKSF